MHFVIACMHVCKCFLFLLNLQLALVQVITSRHLEHTQTVRNDHDIHLCQHLLKLFTKATLPTDRQIGRMLYTKSELSAIFWF